MSFPTVQLHLENQGVSDPREASADQLHTAFIAAFRDDLPLGMDHLELQADETLAAGRRVLKNKDPSSPLGKQLARLCGPDIARRHVSEEFGVAIGFYNCCGVVTAPSINELNMSEVEQVMLQNGQLAHADC